MSITFRIKASEAQGRRLDPEYHHALRRTRIRSTYPSAKLLSLSYFRTGGTPSTAHSEYWSDPIPPRLVQDRIASTASSIRAEVRKLKADAAAALDAAKRRIEARIVK